MRLKILSILFLSLLAISVFAEEGPLYVQSSNCGKDGSLELVFGSFSTNNIYIGDISIKTEYIGDLFFKKTKFDVIGEWSSDVIKDSSERTTLTTEEAIFNLEGDYMLTINYMHNDNSYTIEHETECSGFEFSCKLLGVYVDYCKNYNDGKFEASAKIFGLGEITKENLTIDENIQFMLQTEENYEDKKGKISVRGGIPKETIITNPKYGQYYFNLTWDNKIKSFVAKIIGINYIEGGCVNFPNISLYDYKECEDIEIEEKPVEKVEAPVEEKEVEKPVYISEAVKELEKNVGTKTAKASKTPLIILFSIFGLCVIGTLYIVFKRKFNKEPSL